MLRTLLLTTACLCLLTANGWTAAPPKAPTFSTAEQSERQKILSSREWYETQRAFHEWLSVQKIYTPQEVKQIRAAMKKKVAKMSPAQLRDFLEDSKDKLAVLMSKQAEEARLWLAQRMAVEVKLTPEEIKKERPDVLHMTSAQLEQWLLELQQQRQQTRQTQQAFDKGRQTQVKNIEAAEAQQEKEREEALDRAYYDQNNAYGGYYGGSLNNPVYRGAGYYGGAGYRY